MTLHSSEGEPAPTPPIPHAPANEDPRGALAPSAVALERGARALLAKQSAEGSWEGEVVWSAMITAQLVLACHILGRPIDPARRKRILLYFERTRLSSGTWGLSAWSPPNLFVTTLVYVAARMLGVAANDPLVARGLAFMRGEDVSSIPSWGKFWLALVNLYAWEGVNPVSPEIWGMPRWLPIHPSRYYCHTRLIYMGMAALYGQRVTARLDPILRAIRVEIYPNGYEAVDFRAARTRLRRDDLYAPPSLALRASYDLLVGLERVVGTERRARSVRVLIERIRHELRTTNHTSISPVSGLLNILALFAASGPDDPDVLRAAEKLEDWIWEDDAEGMRVTGARSSTWDTSFAILALAEAAPHVEVKEGLARGDRFLGTQQMRGALRLDDRAQTSKNPLPASEIDRIEPDGGFCFAGVWHGWPVSDCTAEAILARLEASARTEARAPADTRTDVDAAARFILRTQNADGGFGSYEPRRTPFSLEWLNPAEMFGDSMTEGSYVECTASCIAALAASRAHVLDKAPVDAAIRRAVRCLRGLQLPTGAWPGVWGVRLVYGTLFGIRGLLAGGVSSGDPQIRKACAMLKAHQRADGSWGEAHVPAPSATYREAERGHVVQTAWALSALLAAEDPDEQALARAARYLAREQLPSGEWEQAEPAGVFFHTALLDYRLYKTYFPVWALGQYETFRKRTRTRSSGPESTTPRSRGGRPIPRLSGGLPLVGHLVPFVRTAVELLQRARAECGDVAAFDVGPKRMVLLTGPKASEAFFRSRDEVLSPAEAYRMMEPVFGKDVVYDAPPAKMAEQFAMLLPCLQDRRMRSYGEVIASEVLRSIQGWGEEGVLDVYEYARVLTNFTSSTCLLGREFREEMTEEFAQIYGDLEQGITPLAFLNARLPIPSFRKRDRARVRLVELVTRIIADRRRTRREGEDFLQILMEAKYESGEPLSEHEITGLLLAAMFAGHHTSAVTVAWMMLELTRAPALYERVQNELFGVLGADGPVTYASLREIPVTEGCVKETLRLHPPLFMLMRVALRDWEYDGYLFPKGTHLLVSPTVTHRMPDLFRDPDRFDPDRFGPGREEDKRPFSFQAFGGGAHKCLGNAFALLQIKTVFAILLRRYELSSFGDPLASDFHGVIIGPKQPCRVHYRRISAEKR